MSSPSPTLTSISATTPTDAANSTSASDVNCGNGGGSNGLLQLRIAAVFIILVTSTTGALFPVIARRTRLRNVIPKPVFDFAKYFGSGVIIATAFIHLLSPGISELMSPCLTGQWQVYPWALAICMLSIFFIFFVELAAFRWGMTKLAKLGIVYNPHGHGHGHGGSHAAHGPELIAATDSFKSVDMVQQGQTVYDTENQAALSPIEPLNTDKSNGHVHTVEDSALAQIVGIFTLEFGVLLHSILIGLTLAVDPAFKVLFVVIIFHQLFEGLGLGSRLAFLQLPPKYNYVAIVAAVLYGLTTPIGIAAGLGVRSTYNPDSTRASIVSGIMDSLSAGVLIYTGLVELMAHEFLFSAEMSNARTGKLLYACGCMCLGAGLMSLLGRWA